MDLGVTDLVAELFVAQIQKNADTSALERRLDSLRIGLMALRNR